MCSCLAAGAVRFKECAPLLRPAVWTWIWDNWNWEIVLDSGKNIEHTSHSGLETARFSRKQMQGMHNRRVVPPSPYQFQALEALHS